MTAREDEGAVVFHHPKTNTLPLTNGGLKKGADDRKADFHNLHSLRLNDSSPAQTGHPPGYQAEADLAAQYSGRNADIR